MLIEFTVRNYRSFRDEQSWTLTADPEISGPDMPLADVPKTGEQVVPSAVLYGPNASGKTNLLRALDTMQDIVLYSANSSQRGDEIQGIEPFQFDLATQDAPTLFEAVFVEDGVRYQYGFEVTRTEITDEWLFAYPKGESQKWFERSGNEADGAVMEFGSQFRGQKSVIQQATRPNALFLSTAIQLNNDQVVPVFDWFKNRLRFTRATNMTGMYTVNMIEEDDRAEDVISLVSKADLGITDVKVEEAAPNSDHVIDALQKFIKSEMGDSAKIVGDETRRVKFVHQSGSESYEMNFADESRGTQQYFALAGPILDVIRNGRVIAVDELDSSLHPMMVRAIVRFFHDPKTNPHGAQLLFNTHDTMLLDSGLFRRDQIWFTEKFGDGATRLYSLLDFEEPTDDRAQDLAQRYLQGRYGAIPILQFSSTTPAVTNGAEAEETDA